ncbi:hypothetical protein [Corynebacterium deserti]|nr:hypothetical protein [Corynebacterium deserti]
MGEWYAALEAVDPVRVHDWHVNIEGLEPRGRRYDTALFEVLLDALPPLK